MSKLKKLGTFLLCLSLVIVFTGCSNKKAETKYYDTDFMTALASGLEARWKIAEADDDSEESTKADYASWIKAEKEKVSEYRNKRFKNSKLQELAITYINNLKAQKDTLKYFGADDFDDKWLTAYDKRTKTLVAINKIHKIKVAEKYQSTLDELLGNGNSVNKKDNKDKKVANLIKTIKFTPEPKEYAEDDYTTYSTEVTNTTGFDIDSFSANVKLKDHDGTTVDTQYISTDNWNNGDKVKFDFSTDEEVASYEVIKEFVDY